MYRFNGILKLVFHSMVIQSLYYFKIEAFNKVVLYDKKKCEYINKCYFTNIYWTWGKHKL